MHPNLSTFRTAPQTLTGQQVSALRSDLRISLCKSVNRLAHARVTGNGMPTALAHVAANLGVLLEVQVGIAQHAAANGADFTHETTEDARQ